MTRSQPRQGKGSHPLFELNTERSIALVQLPNVRMNLVTPYAKDGSR